MADNGCCRSRAACAIRCYRGRYKCISFCLTVSSLSYSIFTCGNTIPGPCTICEIVRVRQSLCSKSFRAFYRERDVTKQIRISTTDDLIDRYTAELLFIRIYNIERKSLIRSEYTIRSGSISSIDGRRSENISCCLTISSLSNCVFTYRNIIHAPRTVVEISRVCKILGCETCRTFNCEFNFIEQCRISTVDDLLDNDRTCGSGVVLITQIHLSR